MLKILLSNDDGINAKGLRVLYEELRDIAKVFVIAPENNQSGAGCSITTKRPLKAKPIEDNFIAINGTPADCVYLGLNSLCPFKPDLVISGINSGVNVAEDLLYSGTVGAALEGRYTRFPSISVSVEYPHNKIKEMEPNYRTASLVVRKLIQNISTLDIDSSITLNVNVPNLEYKDLKGVLMSKIGTWGNRNPPEIEIQANGDKRYWISPRKSHPLNLNDTDISILEKDMVSVTPLSVNFLSGESGRLNSWLGSTFL